MKYFETLPKISVSDFNGNNIVATNLLARAELIPSLAKNPILFYKYDIQDKDTPEIIAHKYYNDMYRYWIVLFSNEMLDPQWSWPLNYNQFTAYINDKYGPTDVYSTIHHYEKTITQYDTKTYTTTTNTIQIDEQVYNSLVETSNTYSLPTGDVTVTITKQAVSVYDYELNTNESKRTINILIAYPRSC